MSSRSKKNNGAAVVRISSDVVRQIRQHSRANSKTEVCGVLIGSDADGATSIETCIAGVNATQGGAHVTFTQDTWEHIYKIKDRDHPDDRIVGWYHSHPGFGVFLSDHDTFIHKNFFSSPQQVAWVYDPHTDEEGCFGWAGHRLERLADFNVFDGKGGEGAGETGKPEPTVFDVENAGERGNKIALGMQDSEDDPSALLRMVVSALSYVSIFLLGAAMVWYLFPRVAMVGVPVDPRTGQPLMSMPQDQSGANPGPTVNSAPQSGNMGNSRAVPNNSGNAKGSNAQRQ